MQRQFSFHKPFWYFFQKLLIVNKQPENNDLKKAWQKSARSPQEHGWCINPEWIQKPVAASPCSFTEVTMSLVQ